MIGRDSPSKCGPGKGNPYLSWQLPVDKGAGGRVSWPRSRVWSHRTPDSIPDPPLRSWGPRGLTCLGSLTYRWGCDPTRGYSEASVECTEVDKGRACAGPAHMSRSVPTGQRATWRVGTGDWGLGRGARLAVQNLGRGWHTSHAQERVFKDELSRELRKHLSRHFQTRLLLRSYGGHQGRSGPCPS